MTDTSILAPLALVLTVVALLIIYVIRGKLKQRQTKDGYRWKPEQDYDVVMRGETPMTPGFPTLIKRDDKKENSDS